MWFKWFVYFWYPVLTFRLGFRYGCSAWYTTSQAICTLFALCDVLHDSDVMMSAMASQIISLTIVYSTVCSGGDQMKTSKLRVAGLSVRSIHRWPVNSPQKGPVTRKMFPFDDVIMVVCYRWNLLTSFRITSLEPAKSWYFANYGEPVQNYMDK